MKWLLSNWRSLLWFTLAGCVVAFGSIAQHYRTRAVTAEAAVSSAEAISRNATAAINLMYDISKATHEEKQQLAGEGEKRVVYIREAVKGDDCAVRDVPAAAADSLRMYENSIRSGNPATDKS